MSAQCKANSSKGHRCKNLAVKGEQFCSIHLKDEVPEVVPESDGKTLLTKVKEWFENNKLFVVIAIVSIGLLGTISLIKGINDVKDIFSEDTPRVSERDIDNAEELYRDVSELIGARYRKMDRLYFAYNDSIPDKSQQWEVYREVLDLWNMNLTKNEGLIKRYFGDDRSVFFISDIHYSFRKIGQLLEKVKKSESNQMKIDSDLIEIRQKLNRLNLTIGSFNDQMNDILREGNVGQFEDEQVSLRGPGPLNDSSGEFELEIVFPEKDDQKVNRTYTLRGLAEVPEGYYLWAFVAHESYSKLGTWWPQGWVKIRDDNTWKQDISLGDPSDLGESFIISAAIVGEKDHELLMVYIKDARASSDWAPIRTPRDVKLIQTRRVIRR